MKVNNVGGSFGAYRQNGARKAAPSQETARPSRGDEVSLSAEAQLVRSLKETLAQTPEIRQQRVDELRAQIEAGTYHPNGREVAAKLIKSRVLDELI